MDVIKYKMMYKIQKNKHNIRILGNEFIKNNRNKGKLIIKNKKQYFREFSHLEKINEKQLKIKMILSNNIYNLSYMFKECESLCRFSIYDKQKNIPEVNSINLVQKDYFSENGESDNDNNISFEKFSYESLNDLNLNPIHFSGEISYDEEEIKTGSSLIDMFEKLDYPKIDYIIMNKMFYNCFSLISLTNISIWENIHIINMSQMFYNCKSLISLPDISKWNTHNVTDMSGLFYNCNSLKFLPGILKWNTYKVKNMSHMFYNCKSL